MIDQIKTDFEKTVKSLGLSKEDIKFKKEFLDRFISNGFPSRKLENWKFLDINKIIQKNIEDLSFFNENSSPNKVDTSIFVNGLNHNKIVFINGKLEKIDFSHEEKNKIIINESLLFEKKNKNKQLFNRFK